MHANLLCAARHNEARSLARAAPSCTTPLAQDRKTDLCRYLRRSCVTRVCCCLLALRHPYHRVHTEVWVELSVDCLRWLCSRCSDLLQRTAERQSAIDRRHLLTHLLTIKNTTNHGHMKVPTAVVPAKNITLPFRKQHMRSLKVDSTWTVHGACLPAFEHSRSYRETYTEINQYLHFHTHSFGYFWATRQKQSKIF